MSVSGATEWSGLESEVISTNASSQARQYGWTWSPVVETPRRSATNNNRSLAVMEASAIEAPHCHIPVARGAVSYTSIASLNLQTFIDPSPLDQLLCYSANVVHSWPAEDRVQILAVANRDISIARRNLTELTRYVDTHAAHLAACVGAFDDSIPLMAAEYQRVSVRPCK